MRLFKSIISFGLLAILSSTYAESVDSYLETIKSDPNALYAFFKEMPKGGELHYHLDGGVYPETMLDLAATSSFCIDPNTFVIKPYSTQCEGITANSLETQKALYTKTIRAWSMRDFVPGKESAQDHFHSVFAKINGLESNFRPQILAEIMQRAADQHELYLEIYLSADSLHSISFSPLLKDKQSFAEKQRILLNNQDFQDNIKHTIEESQHILNAAREQLHCNTDKKEPACNLTVKFQYYVLREKSQDEVFAQALTGFEVAHKSNDVVGVNLVQVEDSFIALRNYHQHMQVFEFLHQQYPEVNIALHAGEMNPESVRPKDLRFHIRDAIKTGHAKRIGHGVSVAYEDNANALLDDMHKNPTPVEINLISNRVALNLPSRLNPLRLYLSKHVPVVLSTDDEGILRTDLTRQYVEAVLHHGLDYSTIKLINRNALTYNFLTGQSLWENAEKQIPVPACHDLLSNECKQFIHKNPKAQLQWQLENQLIIFEKNHKTQNSK